MQSTLRTLAFTLTVTGCAGVAVGPSAAVAGGAAGIGLVTGAAAGVISKGVVNLRTGSVLLDSVSWSPAPGDSTAFTARGMLTWRKAKAGPNKTTYLNLGGSVLGGEAAASGLFQVDLLDTKGRVLITVGPTAVKVFDGGTPIQMIPADKSFPFEVRTAPIPWNILRDAKNKRLRYQVSLR